MMPATVTFLLSYLAGSIPYGLILVRLAGKGDLRAIGSGNIGATNVLRTGSKPLAFATLLLDAGKGAAAVMIAGDERLAVIAAAGAFLGHLFPVWLRFRGGKGVATTLGIYLAIAWPVGAAACATWLLIAILLRYSSLAALMAMCGALLAAVAFADQQIGWLALGLGAIVWQRHTANIKRLIAGTEPRIGKSKPAGDA